MFLGQSRTGLLVEAVEYRYTGYKVALTLWNPFPSVADSIYRTLGGLNKVFKPTSEKDDGINISC